MLKAQFETKLNNFILQAGIAAEKEIHVLFGPSGCGKTTLLKSIAGLMAPQTGCIELNGRMLFDSTSRINVKTQHRKIGFVPQDYALFPNMSVENNVGYGIEKRSGNYMSKINNMLEMLQIAHLRGRFPGHLSGGEKQRVALARALITEPELLLLDEPLSALHPSLRWDLQSLLKKLQQELGITVLMVSHDMEEALYMGDKVSLLINGRIQQTGKGKEVYRCPKTLAAARYFGIQNLFKGEVLSIDDEWVDIKTFGDTRLTVKRSGHLAGIKKGSDIYWGIHAEEITVVKPERKTIERKNLLQGRIDKIHERGRYFTLFFTAKNVDDYLEINIPDFAIRKLGIQPGTQAEIELNETKIFIIGSDL